MHHRIAVYCDVDNKRKSLQVEKRWIWLFVALGMRLVGYRRLPVAPEQMGVFCLVCPQPTGIAYAPVKDKMASNKRIQRDDMMMDDNKEQKKELCGGLFWVELKFILLYG